MRLKGILCFLLVLSFLSVQMIVYAQNSSTDRIDQTLLGAEIPESSWLEVLLELNDLPAVEYWQKTNKIEFLSTTSMLSSEWLQHTASYQSVLRDKQERFLSWAGQKRISIIPKHHLYLTLNAITAEVKKSDLALLSKSSSLNKIHDIRQEFKLTRQLGAKSSGAEKAWAGYPDESIPSLSGKNVLVGVMDTGLDTQHPEFNRKGKVRGGFNFAENNSDLSDASSHGTHVAGIAAGQGSNEKQYGRGMAYDADIMVYKIFSKDNMSSADVFGAMEQATKDRCNVLNLSFGGSSNESSSGNSAYHRSMRNADKAGVFVVAGAGNSGARRKEIPWPIIIPSIIDSTFCVAGSDDRTEAPLILSQSNGKTERTFQAIQTPNSNRLQKEMLKNGIVFSAYGQKEDFASLNLSNKVALIQRGPSLNGISYRDKLENAYRAGAVGVIFFNNTPHQNTAPHILRSGENSTHVKHLPPSISLSMEDGEELKQILTQLHTISIEYQQFSTIASFSSMGLSGDSAFKPEITAPATRIVSSIPGGKYSPMDGTSMATPMISGLSALLKQARPMWTHQQIKSAFMNTADIMINPTNKLPISFTLQGAGTARLDKAIHTPAFLEPRALVFSETSDTVSQTIKVSNNTNKKQVFSLSAEFFHLKHETLPLNITFDKNEISLEAYKEAHFSISLQMDRKAFLQNRYEGIIKVGNDLHIPVICYRDPASRVEEAVSNIRISQDPLDLTKSATESMSPLQISFSLNAGDLSSIITKEYTYHYGENYGSVNFYIADEDQEEWAKVGSMNNIMVGEYTFLWNGRDEHNQLFLPAGKFFLHFTMSMKEYKDQQWTTKTYGPFRQAFNVIASDLPEPVPARLSAYKLFSENQKLHLGVRFEDFKTIINPDEELSQIEFKLHYPGEPLMYKRYVLKGILANMNEKIQVEIDDDPEGILGVKIICENLLMKHLYDLSFIDLEFNIIDKGKLLFVPRSFALRSTKGVNYRVKAPSIQSRVIDRSYLLCDLNKDNVVDRMDFALFMTSFGSKQGDTTFDERSDFNQDLRIDMLDFLTLSKEMGKYI
ncbi:MAG TPA: S8 family serine peptidase [Caldisericia bacterium]|nr:S8 family serine peptidase [Caldisericia bacterium]